MTTKICTTCKIEKDYIHFHKHSGCVGGYNTVCKECRKPLSKKQYKEKTTEYKLFYAARHRARKRNLEFSLGLEDIVIPDICPVLQIPLKHNTDYAPSLDRFDSSLGYTKENVRVISFRANMIKSNATLDEMQKVLNYLKKGNCDL